MERDASNAIPTQRASRTTTASGANKQRSFFKVYHIQVLVTPRYLDHNLPSRTHRHRTHRTAHGAGKAASLPIRICPPHELTGARDRHLVRARPQHRTAHGSLTCASGRGSVAGAAWLVLSPV